VTTTYIVRYGQMPLSWAEYVGLAGPGAPARGSVSSCGAIAGRSWASALPATIATAQFLENPVQGEILRTAHDRGPGGRATAGRAPKDGFAACRELSPGAACSWTWSMSRRSSRRERMVFITWPRNASIFASWSRIWHAPSRPGSSCGQIGVRDEAKLLADYGDCASPFVAIPTCRRCPRLRCGWQKSKKRRSTPRTISGRMW